MAFDYLSKTCEDQPLCLSLAGTAKLVWATTLQTRLNLRKWSPYSGNSLNDYLFSALCQSGSFWPNVVCQLEAWNIVFQDETARTWDSNVALSQIAWILLTVAETPERSGLGVGQVYFSGGVPSKCITNYATEVDCLTVLTINYPSSPEKIPEIKKILQQGAQCAVLLVQQWVDWQGLWKKKNRKVKLPQFIVSLPHQLDWK